MERVEVHPGTTIASLQAQDKQSNLTVKSPASPVCRCTLISPFPGRVLEWSKADNPKGPQSFKPEEDPGVVACRSMYAYFKKHGHDTICMPASWRR